MKWQLSPVMGNVAATSMIDIHSYNDCTTNLASHV